MRPDQIYRLRDSGLPGNQKPVRLIETHISWILAGKTRVWKIKKPLHLPWLHSDSLENRQALCEKEVVLNQRTSPDIYLGVVPIKEQDHQVMLGGPEGEIIDYAVEMTRMQESGQLDYLLHFGKVTEVEIRNLAAVVARFHKEAPVVQPEFSVGEWQSRFEDIRRMMDLPGLCGYWKAFLEYATEVSRLFLAEHGSLIRSRIEAGWFRDLHGDLHAGNIFLRPRPVLFDCLEFNDDLRCVDVLDELAFLVMDLASFQRQDLATAFLDAYLAEIPAMTAQDQSLFAWYQCYRANIRAKVHAMYLLQGNLSETQERMHQSRMEQYFVMMEATLPRLTSSGMISAGRM